MAEEEVGSWSSELTEGRLRVTNGEMTIMVDRDFSGEVTTADGECIAFTDLRDFIDAGKILEQVLTDKYGGYR